MVFVVLLDSYCTCADIDAKAQELSPLTWRLGGGTQGGAGSSLKRMVVPILQACSGHARVGLDVPWGFYLKVS